LLQTLQLALFSAEQKLLAAQKENDRLVAEILDMKERDVQASLTNGFPIDVTFEMRTLQSEICLFNDNLFRHGHHIYMKRKEGKIAERHLQL
jgi:hypothetical protein